MSAERSTKLALEAEVRQLRQRIAGLEQECQQQFLASLLAHAPYGVSVCKGRELRYELVNPAYQEMVGPDIPLVGRRYSEIFPEAAAAGAEARLLEVIDTAEPWIISGFKAPIPGKPDATWAGQVVCLPAATDGEPALLSIVWDVTEQVGANEARRDIEARFRALVTSTSDVVFQSDGDRIRVLSLHSPSYVSDLEGPTTAWLEKYIHPDDLQRVKAAVGEAIRTQGKLEIEHQVLRADGTSGWSFTRAIPIRNANGEVLDWFGTASDITERKQAEERTRQHNRINEAVNGILSMALLDVSEEELGRQSLAIIEEATESKFGFISEINASGQLENIAISDPGWEGCGMVLPGGKRKPPAGFKIHGIYGRVILDGKALFTNDPASHPDSIGLPEGHPSLKAFLGAPMKQNGKAIGIIAVANRDGGYRQQDLECLEALSTSVVQMLMRTRTERALRESEEQFRVLTENLVSGVALVDRHGDFKIVNKSFLHMFGENDPSEIPNLHSPDGSRLRMCDEKGRLLGLNERPAHKALLTSTAVRDQLVTVQWPESTELKWLLVSAEPTLDRRGKVQHLICTYYDITARKLAEAEVERQNQAKDRFLAMLGHELRNPLAAMNSAAELLAGASLKERSSLEELMGRQIQVLRRLVDDLLDISRVEQGRISLQKEPVTLMELLKAAALVAQSPISARMQELVLRLPSEPVPFLADRVRLEQVVANLLDNASKYTEQGGRIELSGAKEGSEIVIRCKDNGHGIRPEMQASIFEPFTRGEQDGTSSGAGLGIGLSLVKRLVELHDGTISVESGGIGAGSEFTVRLPWLKAPAAPRPAGPLKVAAPSRRPLSIAIVEDNPDVARTRAMGLEKAGHKVALFTDAASALARIPRLKPDTLLIDIGLPDMDGYELAAKLRGKPELRRALFVAISGFKRRPQSWKSSDAFDQYLVKPVGPSEILALLDASVRPGARKAKGVKVREAPERRKSLRVLLVEDHAELAELTAKMLRGEGLEVRVAASGQEALNAASEFGPQLVLCDLRLPDISGRDVIRALRTNPATENAYAVILTALSLTEVQAYNCSAKANGVDEYISKPLTTEVLRDLLPRLRTPPSTTPK